MRGTNDMTGDIEFIFKLLLCLQVITGIN